MRIDNARLRGLDVNIGVEGTTNIDNFSIRPVPRFVSTVTISEGVIATAICCLAMKVMMSSTAGVATL